MSLQLRKPVAPTKGRTSKAGMNLIHLTVILTALHGSMASSDSDMHVSYLPPIPDVPLSRTISEFHKHFPNCFAEIITFHLHLDLTLLQHQPYTYASDLPWSNTTKDYHWAHLDSVLTRHVNCYFHSVALLNSENFLYIFEDQILDSIIVHNFKSLWLVRSKVIRHLAHFVLIFCESDMERVCSRVAGHFQSDPSVAHAVAFVILYPSQNRDLQFKMGGIQPGHQRIGHDVGAGALSGYLQPFSGRYQLEPTKVKFDCDLQQCKNAMVRTYVAWYQEENWTIHSDSPCTAAKGIRGNSLTLCSFVSENITFRPEPCRNFGSDELGIPGLKASSDCFTHRYLYDHEMHVLEGSDPEFVII